VAETWGLASAAPVLSELARLIFFGLPHTKLTWRALRRLCLVCGRDLQPSTATLSLIVTI
jgi:hypothetical protein